jgi:inosine-uridine nucleoside N-ribohydrolase
MNTPADLNPHTANGSWPAPGRLTTVVAAEAWLNQMHRLAGFPALEGSPLIIDTAVGDDPGAAVALVVAALGVCELALVVTHDEYDGQRARLARHLLDLCGRADVPVVAGRRCDQPGQVYCGGLIPARAPAPPWNVVAAVGAVCGHESSGAVRWLGLGALSNLADVLQARPWLAERLFVYQTGGPVDHGDPLRVEYPFALDPIAVTRVLAVLPRLWLVTRGSSSACVGITPDSLCYRRVSGQWKIPNGGQITPH